MRVAFYARVSTDKQAEKYGIPSQIEVLRKRCLERGWTPVLDGDKDAFIDDGYSGAELDRPALNRLRQATREGRVDVVLAYDPDRLSRKLYHQMILAEEFEKQGIKLEFFTQDMGTSPEDRMFFNMRGLVAEYEREKIRERTMRGSREKARQGKVVSAGAIPFGFCYNKERATLEENSEKAQIIRLIFYTFANESLSLQSLADRLNRLHIPTPKGGDRWRARPCSCPEVKAETIEPTVWDTLCQLIRDPDFLIQELHKRNADNSQTKGILERELQLCQARLKAIPDEQKRLVEGYRKGLYADFMMREDMELIQKEQGELEKRKSELERQLAQRQLTESQEERIRSFAEKVCTGLDTLDFPGRQELVRLLVEKVIFDGQGVEILTIIPLGEQLHPIHRGGQRG